MRKITENLRKLYNLGYQILEKWPHMESLSAKNPKEGCIFGLNFLKQVAIEIQERNTPVKNCLTTSSRDVRHLGLGYTYAFAVENTTSCPRRRWMRSQKHKYLNTWIDLKTQRYENGTPWMDIF